MIGAAKDMKSKIILRKVPNAMDPHTDIRRLYLIFHVYRNDKVITAGILS